MSSLRVTALSVPRYTHPDPDSYGQDHLANTRLAVYSVSVSPWWEDTTAMRHRSTVTLSDSVATVSAALNMTTRV